MAQNITADELFGRIRELLTATDLQPATRNSMMHEVLVLCCHEGVRDTEQSFGNLFSQVDFLCKRHRVGVSDKADIQTMRRHSNGSEPLAREELLYDGRALSIFVSAVMGKDIPSGLTEIIPHTHRPHQTGQEINSRQVRCVVDGWDDNCLYATPDGETGGEQYAVRLRNETDGTDHSYLTGIIRKGTQLNLLDCHIETETKADSGERASEEGRGQRMLTARIIVVEPDFLIDISSIAACFAEYGHHPMLYLLNQMKPRGNTQATLLGSFAGAALDDIVNSRGDYNMNDTVRSNFREKALEFTTCRDFNAQKFYADALVQAGNLQRVVDILFGHGNGSTDNLAPTPSPTGEERGMALLEPSFVCEALGIQGRVDLMTTDMRLLVEQKSGRNMNIERGRPNIAYHSYQLEPHYVQLLLYYGVLRYNFRLGTNTVDIRLLYSKYPPKDGLMVVAYYHRLFLEAIAYRNRLVAMHFDIARKGFERYVGELTPETLNVNGATDFFYNTYLRPPLEELTAPLHRLTPLQRDYFNRMMTFVVREQLIGKVGSQEGTNTSSSDLWGMPLAEKRDTGNIYTGLRIMRKERSSDYNGYDTVTLSVPEQEEDFLPNFRVGDMVYLYAYAPGESADHPRQPEREPDVRHAILYKGVLEEIRTDRIVVHLNDGQQREEAIDALPGLPAEHTGAPLFAIEHGTSDIGAASQIKALHRFAVAGEAFKDLLLGRRAPESDPSRQLTRPYDATLDDILLRAKQTSDYFLLVGPPGTGKTSRALRFMVEEALASHRAGDGTSNTSLLLLSYTNRAVDEICDMLIGAGIDFLRIGNEFSCDTRFRPHLIGKAIAEHPRLDDMRHRLTATNVIVGTTSMIASRPYIFDLKRFDLAIIDEAGQILEPNIIGLLAMLADRPAEDGGQATDGSRLRRPKFILIGDHKQLPAVVQQSEKESAVAEQSLRDICLDNCRNSLFERLLRWERHEGREAFVGILRRQGRMHPDVAEFPNRMFYHDEHLEPVPCPHQKETALYPPAVVARYAGRSDLDDLLLSHRMVFIPSEFCRQPNVSEKVNIREADTVCEVLQRVYTYYGDRFDPDKTVGVIVPYRNQIAMIRKRMERLGLPGLERVSIDTVERYQGSQRDVIIYSFTIQNRWQMEFLTASSFVENGHIIDRKLNVAITRARRQMVMTGNPNVLHNNLVFRQLINFCREKGGFPDMKKNKRD